MQSNKMQSNNMMIMILINKNIMAMAMAINS